MTSSNHNIIKATAILLIFLSLTLRLISIPRTNDDMKAHNVSWYMTLYENGVVRTLETSFANYTPPYTYFLALATLTHDFIPPLTAIKIIPMCFDVLDAFIVYKIVRLKFKQGYKPILAAVLFFTAPTIILNSACWGQTDSLYTFFLTVCLYYLMTGKSFWSLLAFGVAFSIKAQAVFLFPFLVVMAIRKRIPWYYFGLLPLVYLLAIFPVVLLGRPLLETLLIYNNQFATYSRLSMLAPSIYTLIPNEWYSFIMPAGIIVTMLLISHWIYATSQSRMGFDNKHIILIAFISVALVPFLLPKMHDRYFYPADVFSIVLAFYWPALWFVPILCQFASGSAVSVFLFGTNSSLVAIGFLLNTIALMAALRTQRVAENRDAINPRISSTLSWLVTVLTPFILFCASMDLLLTPAFIRFQYAMPYMPTDQHGLDKSERFKRASQTVDYLTNNKKNQYLNKLEFKDGSPVFDDREIPMLGIIKTSVQKIYKAWHLSLAACFIIGLLAWVGDWLSKFRQGTRRGGWLTIGMIIPLAIGFISLLKGLEPVAYLQQSDTLMRLFPTTFWWTSLVCMLLGIGGGGFLLTRIPINSGD